MIKDRNGCITYKYIGERGNYVGVIKYGDKYYAPMDGSTRVSYLYEIIDNICDRHNNKLELGYEQLDRIRKNAKR